MNFTRQERNKVYDDYFKCDEVSSHLLFWTIEDCNELENQLLCMSNNEKRLKRLFENLYSRTIEPDVAFEKITMEYDWTDGDMVDFAEHCLLRSHVSTFESDLEDFKKLKGRIE